VITSTTRPAKFQLCRASWSNDRPKLYFLCCRSRPFSLLRGRLTWVRQFARVRSAVDDVAWQTWQTRLMSGIACGHDRRRSPAVGLPSPTDLLMFISLKLQARIRMQKSIIYECRLRPWPGVAVSIDVVGQVHGPHKHYVQLSGCERATSVVSRYSTIHVHSHVDDC